MINVDRNQNVQSSQVANIVTCVVMVTYFVHFMDAGLGYPEGCNWTSQQSCWDLSKMQ